MKKILLTSLIASAVVINGINLSLAEEKDNFQKGIGDYRQEQKSKWANEHKMNKQGKPVKPGEMLSKKLNLSPEQETKAKAMRESSRNTIKPLFENLRNDKEKLSQMKQSGASEQELQKQLEKVHNLKLKIREVHKSNLSEFEKILNSDQKLEFQKLKEQKMQMMKEKHEKFKQEPSVK